MHDLSGRWRGLYSYPAVLDPVPFTALLRHEAEWLTGTTAETASGVPGGAVMRASLDGRVGGNQVAFLKTYHRQNEEYDAVRYAGEVEPEGQEIWGHWTVPGHWSGTFLMIRDARPAVALAARWFERV